MNKKQGKKTEIIETILLNLLRILYFIAQSWSSFCLWWSISDNGLKDAILDYEEYVVIFIGAPIFMTVLEVVRVQNYWNKQGINRKILIAKSVLVLASPLLGFFFVPWVMSH